MALAGLLSIHSKKAHSHGHKAPLSNPRLAGKRPSHTAGIWAKRSQSHKDVMSHALQMDLHTVVANQLSFCSTTALQIFLLQVTDFLSLSGHMAKLPKSLSTLSIPGKSHPAKSNILKKVVRTSPTSGLLCPRHSFLRCHTCFPVLFQHLSRQFSSPKQAGNNQRISTKFLRGRRKYKGICSALLGNRIHPWGNLIEIKSATPGIRFSLFSELNKGK